MIHINVIITATCEKRTISGDFLFSRSGLPSISRGYVIGRNFVADLDLSKERTRAQPDRMVRFRRRSPMIGLAGIPGSSVVLAAFAARLLWRLSAL
jgi:hypothetical protein